MPIRGFFILIFTAFTVLGTGLPVQEAQAQRIVSCEEIDQIPFNECKALELLFWNTNGPEWVDTGKWLLTNQPCSWRGVTCNATFWPRNVTKIEFVNNNLNGPLPVELSFLSELTHLVIENRPVSGDLLWLTGNIPSSVGDLEHLQVLKLNYHQITGELPDELGRLEHLEVIELSNNLIDDFLPVDFGKIKSLRTLNLSNNQLKGRIPDAFGQLDSLKILDLSNNQLDGFIPESLGNLSTLFKLNLAGNNFPGALPPSLGNITSLRWLSLQNNAFSGPIHPGFVQMAEELEFCALENNAASLCLPERGFRTNTPGTDFCGLPVESDCSICQTQRLTVPTASCQALESLYYDTDGLNWNDASGWLANDDPCSWFGINCTPAGAGQDAASFEIDGITLPANNLAGTLSEKSGQLPPLQALDLSMNRLTGPVPFTFAALGAGTATCSLAGNEANLCVPADSQYTALGLPLICELPLSSSCSSSTFAGPTRFNVSQEPNHLRFTWQLNTQPANLTFEIEQKQGDAFVSIDAFSIAEAARNDDQFEREIPKPAQGIYIFRLKQLTTAGDILVSDVIAVVVDADAFVASQLFPNPTAARSTFQFAPATAQRIAVTLFDALGRRVRTLLAATHLEPTVHTIDVDLTDMADGTYFIQIQGESFVTSKPLVLAR